MKRPLLAATIVAIAASLALAPASAEPLSRAAAVGRALEHNPDVRRALADNEGLNGRARQAKADALPELNAFGTFLRYQDPSFMNSPNIEEFPPEFLAAFRPLASNLWDGNVTLHQTLLSFSLRKAIRAAGYAKHMGRENVSRARQDVALRTILAYNGYLVALERAKVAATILHQQQMHLEMAKNRREAGVATDLEVLRFEVGLANTRTALLRYDGAAELARGDLNAVMMQPTDTPIEPTDTLGLVDVPEVELAAVRMAAAGRPELRAAAWNEKIYHEAIGVYQADSRPRLDLNASYGYSVRETSNFLESNYKKWSLSVTLKVPIFDGFRTAGKVAQARAEHARVGQDKAALETLVDLEAKQALDRLRVARSVLQSAELNVTQARRALEMTEANYKLGAATTLDVTDAQAAFTQAEMNRVEALWAHANARAGLRYVMGQDPLVDAPAPVRTTSSEQPAQAGGALVLSTAGRQ